MLARLYTSFTDSSQGKKNPGCIWERCVWCGSIITARISQKGTFFHLFHPDSTMYRSAVSTYRVSEATSFSLDSEAWQVWANYGGMHSTSRTKMLAGAMSQWVRISACAYTSELWIWTRTSMKNAVKHYFSLGGLLLMSVPELHIASSRQITEHIM